MSLAFFYKEGISSLADILSGNEKIYFGIRPYGYHAGNMLPSVIYPYLLCQQMAARNKTPCFTIYIFINDWEQDGFEHYDQTKPFDITPKFTTFQFTRCAETNLPIVDRWEVVIRENILKLKNNFPDLRIEVVRNSAMKNDQCMKHVVLKTIENPELVKKALKTATGKQVGLETTYCHAICRSCNSAKTKTLIDQRNITVICKSCEKQSSGLYEDYDYWLYHKPLALPRIKSYDIDLCITGADHYNEGDFDTRRHLFDMYGIEIKLPYTLYTNVLYGEDGRPMGKSKGNAKYLEFDDLMSLVYPLLDQREIRLNA